MGGVDEEAGRLRDVGLPQVARRLRDRVVDARSAAVDVDEDMRILGQRLHRVGQLVLEADLELSRVDAVCLEDRIHLQIEHDAEVADAARQLRDPLLVGLLDARRDSHMRRGSGSRC